MKRWFSPACLVFCLFLLASNHWTANGQSLLSDAGNQAIYQKALDLSSDLNVLMISLQPGFEDLGALSYFRLGKGARVVSAYVTNGEAGESDIAEVYPNRLAALRREEATKALHLIGGEAVFLNMPDVVMASDSSTLRTNWPPDTLRYRLIKLISDSKPDLIILCRDWERQSGSLRWSFVRSAIEQAVGTIRPPVPGKTQPTLLPLPSWNVARLAVAEGRAEGVSPPVLQKHPLLKKTFQEIGRDAAVAYGSLSHQRKLRGQEGLTSYQAIFPAGKKITALDQDLPPRPPVRLRALRQRVYSLATRTMKQASGNPLSEQERSRLLQQLVRVLDSVGVHLTEAQLFDARDRKTLLHWKPDLEDLRNALLGVSVHFTLTESILTNRQLTYLTIDSVTGQEGGGTTEIFFPGVDQGWIINETGEKRWPLKEGEQMRLLSPAGLEFNYPHSQYGLRSETLRNPFLFFILHRATSPQYNFAYRAKLELDYAPRFIAEVLNPIVRVVEGERVGFRLENTSRDGVADQIGVQDSLAWSEPRPFRLSNKGAVHVDTLVLQWKKNLDAGTFLLPISIQGDIVAQVAAREFEARVDSSRRIGVVAGVPNSITLESLRRLGLRYRQLRPSDLTGSMASLDVVVIDRRAMTFHPDLAEKAGDLQEYVRGGGHLVVLQQDAEVWNRNPLWPGLTLLPTDQLGPGAAVQLVAEHPLAVSHNHLTDSDWSGWLYQFSPCRVDGPALEQAEIAVRSQASNLPLVVTKKEGKGILTYVNLSLHHQLLNIHPGTFRFLANLLAY